jgi:UDP-2-acetamido-3-amino-2,3-dideoxy-glucuronate N-acetyltransferase
MSYFRHESAYVDDGAHVGEGSKIWHFCHVASGAKLGRGCVLGQNVYVASTAVLGDGVRVQNNVSIYDGVVLQDQVFVGPSAVFTNVVNPRAEVARKSEYRRTCVGRGASIGANATIVCGHDIGTYAFIGAGAVITKTVGDFELWLGVPAQRVGWICRCGERLSSDVSLLEETLGCRACGASYRRQGDKLCAL